MPIFPNHTKQQLESGKLAIGMGLRALRTSDAGMIAKTCGFDWLFIDMEHSSMNVDLAAQIALASMAMGVTPIVRTPGFDPAFILRLLDMGVQGLQLPHISNAAAALARPQLRNDCTCWMMNSGSIMFCAPPSSAGVT